MILRRLADQSEGFDHAQACESIAVFNLVGPNRLATPPYYGREAKTSQAKRKRVIRLLFKQVLYPRNDDDG